MCRSICQIGMAISPTERNFIMTTPAVSFINDYLKAAITQLTTGSETKKQPMVSRSAFDFLRKYQISPSVDANYLTIVDLNLQKETTQPNYIKITLFDSVKPRMSDYQTLVKLLTVDNPGFIVIESKKSHIIPDSYGQFHFKQPVARIMSFLNNQGINDVLDTPEEAYSLLTFIANLNSEYLCLIDKHLLKLYDLLIDLNQMDVIKVYQNGNISNKL